MAAPEEPERRLPVGEEWLGTSPLLHEVATRHATSRAFGLGAAGALRHIADWLESLAEEFGDAVGLAYIDGMEDAGATGAYDDERAAAAGERRDGVHDGVVEFANDIRARSAQEAARASGVGSAFRELCDVIALEPEHADRLLGTEIVESAAAALRVALAPADDGLSEERQSDAGR